MLDKFIFESFIKEVDDAALVFYTWAEYHDPEKENKKYFDSIYGVPAAMRCAQIMDTSVQHEWIMAVCRLLDPPKSAGKENISIESVIQQSTETSLSLKFQRMKEENPKFFSSYRSARHGYFAHNSLDKFTRDKTLYAGVEKLFEFLEEMIRTLKGRVETAAEFSLEFVYARVRSSVSAFMKPFREYSEKTPGT